MAKRTDPRKILLIGSGPIVVGQACESVCHHRRGTAMLVKVEAYHDGKFWCGRGVGADLFTQGKTLDELMENVKEAAALHFEDALKQGETLNLLVMSEAEIRRGKAATG